MIIKIVDIIIYDYQIIFYKKEIKKNILQISYVIYIDIMDIENELRRRALLSEGKRQNTPPSLLHNIRGDKSSTGRYGLSLTLTHDLDLNLDLDLLCNW